MGSRGNLWCCTMPKVLCPSHRHLTRHVSWPPTNPPHKHTPATPLHSAALPIRVLQTGGLTRDDAGHANRKFSFLDEYNFTLSRNAGKLGSDPAGEQRMVMLGVRAQGRNAHRLPHASRPWVGVNNSEGDLDCYVVQHDQPGRFKTSGLKHVWNALGRRMHRLLPGACADLVARLEDAQVRERFITTSASATCSDDLIVNNVGVSSRYQSPEHVDTNDVGWTFAFAVKCCWECGCSS